MKRFTIIVALLVISLLSAALVSAQSTQAYGTVTAAQLNVRTYPSADADIITTLSQGFTTGVIGRNANASWYQIVLPGGSGWVHAHYLAVVNPQSVPQTYMGAPDPQDNVIAATGYVNTGALNIRPQPSHTGNTPITFIYKGTSVNVLGRNSDTSWYFITTGSVRGWVRSKYITLNAVLTDIPLVTQNPLPTPVPPTTHATAYVNTGALNIRSVPSPYNNIPLTFIFRGTSVSIIGRNANSEWAQVRLNNGTLGWARAKYLTVSSGSLSSAPVTG